MDTGGVPIPENDDSTRLACTHGNIYTSYDLLTPPPRPERPHTRFIAISDTHCASFDVPSGDVLLHSGDLTYVGTLSELRRTMEWIANMNFERKIVIAGNHDIAMHQVGGWYTRNYHGWHQEPEDYNQIYELFRGPDAIKKGVVYLENESYQWKSVNGKKWTVYGSPWQPEFQGWAFNYEENEAEGIVSQFPKTDILITHGPPRNILDLTKFGNHAGCPKLLRHVMGRLKPRLHVFGHIHEARGAAVVSHTKDRSNDNQGETIFINASNQSLYREGATLAHDTNGKRIRAKPGGPGSQPVIVDLFEDV